MKQMYVQYAKGSYLFFLHEDRYSIEYLNRVLPQFYFIKEVE